MKEAIEAIKTNIGRVLVGKEEVTDCLLSAILAGGHVLLEDVPGTARPFWQNLWRRAWSFPFRGYSLRRTCCRLISPVSTITTRRRGEFVFRRGPVFTNLLLADEINRPRPGHSPVCWSVWRSIRSPSTGRQRSWKSRFSSSQPRTPSRQRGRIRSLRPSRPFSDADSHGTSRRKGGGRFLSVLAERIPMTASPPSVTGRHCWR